MGGASSTWFESSTIYVEALIDARSYSADALLAMAETFAIDAADLDPHFPGASGRFLASERLRAIQAELDRRERIARMSNGTATTNDCQHTAWTELARLVRDRVEVPAVFDLAGYALHPAGFNGTRNAEEWAGACVVCGGTDRLRVWAGQNGRAWCRQCGWSADVILVAQSLLPECPTFRDAVRRLAGLADARAEAPR